MANPNASDMEQAEGSRDTIEQNIRKEYPKGETGTGITNRPIDEEMVNQERLPDRGGDKSTPKPEDEPLTRVDI